MKNLILFLLVFSTLCSCKVVKLGNKPLPDPRPYVLLKNGTRIQAIKVEETLERIEADGKRYPKIDVRGFCDGSSTFLAHKGTFYEKIAEGKLDIYNISQYRPGLMTPDQKRAPSLTAGGFSYFTVSGRDSLIAPSYKNLKMFIKPEMPAYHYLELHKKNRHLSTYKAIAAPLMFIGGMTLLVSHIQKDGSIKPGYTVGGLVIGFGGGFGGIISSVLSKQKAERNLVEAVGCYNEVWPEGKGGK